MMNSKYPNTLMQGLHNLREGNQLCDVTISVGGKTLHAHRAVLAASCNYFWTMFTSEFKEKSASEIHMDEIGSAEAFEILLEFVYTGKLNDAQVTRHLYDVLHLAFYLQFTDFFETSSEFILGLFKSEPHRIPVHDVWKIYLLTRDHDNMRDLLAASLRYLDDNVESLKNLDIFLQDVGVTFLQEFLCREDLSSDDDERQVLELVSNWLMHDWAKRRIYANELLQKVHLGLVASDDIRELLGPEILGIPECSDFVNHVLQLQASATSKDTLAYENPNLFMGRSAITAPIASREYNSFEYYNQKTRFWMEMEKMDPLPQMNTSFSILGVSGKLYAAGGVGLSDPEDIYRGKRDFYAYSVWENKWEALPPMSTERLYFPLVYMDGFIYAIGGIVDHIRGTATNKAERYDMARNRWDDIALLPRTCHRLSEIVFGGNIIIYGMKKVFENPTISEHSVMIYQPQRDTWQVTDLANREDFNSWKVSLFCHKNKCYRIMYRSTDKSNYTGLQMVNVLHFQSDEAGTITVTIGEEIAQDHLPPDRGAFRIDDKVFMLINRFVCCTNIKVSPEQEGHVELGLWNRSRYLGSETSNVTLFTFDRKKLSNGKCLT